MHKSLFPTLALLSLPLVLLRSGPVHADPPPDLAPTLNGCQNFTKMQAIVEMIPDRSSRPKLIVLNAQSNWLMADAGWGSRTRWAWKDGELSQHATGSGAGPQPVTKVPVDVIASLWNACRSGFAGVGWTARNPFLDGYRHNFSALGWFKANLPYPWAGGLNLYLGVNKSNKVMTQVAWSRPGDSEWGRITVASVNWSAAATPDFTRLAPSMDLPLPGGYEGIK